MLFHQKINRILEKCKNTPFANEELSPEKWVKYVFLCFFSILSFFAVLIFLLDPYLHYRGKSILPTLYTQPYWMIPGVLRHYHYDSVIIGSSTAQNFNLLHFRQKLGLHPVKATASACYLHTGRRFFETAYRDNPKVRTVIYGLDLFAFFADPDEDKAELPDFLYSGSHLHDYCYWWNFDMLVSMIRDARKMFQHETRALKNYDLMFAQRYERDLRHHGFQTVSNAVRNNVFRPAELTKEDRPVILKKYRENIQKNLRPLLKHPNIRFIFYLSPSSALIFSDALEHHKLELMLELRMMIFDEIRQYPNAVLHDFQVAPETTSLDNYKDLVHYIPPVNDRMVDWMASGIYRIDSRDGIRKNNQILKKNAEELCPLLRKLLQAH